MSMDKKTFDHLVSTLSDKISGCKKVCDVKLEDFDNLSITDARDKINSAKVIQSEMDKVLQQELYHIIGMGDLTVCQQSKFIKLVKEYTSYRTPIKTMAMLQVPGKLTTKNSSDYNCEILNIKVKN